MVVFFKARALLPSVQGRVRRPKNRWVPQVYVFMSKKFTSLRRGDVLAACSPRPWRVAVYPLSVNSPNRRSRGNSKRKRVPEWQGDLENWLCIHG